MIAIKKKSPNSESFTMLLELKDSRELAIITEALITGFCNGHPILSNLLTMAVCNMPMTAVKEMIDERNKKSAPHELEMNQICGEMILTIKAASQQ